MLTELQKKLISIQQNLKVPKNQLNKFGGYNFRSAEDILEYLKPLLTDVLLTIDNEIILKDDWKYVESIVTLEMGTESISKKGFAREEEVKKGMDKSQITGCAMSYANKRALGNLFLIDDTKDADTNQFRAVTNPPVKQQTYVKKKKDSYVAADQNKKVNDTMRAIVSILTSNFSDAKMIKTICRDLGVNDLKSIPSIDIDRKIEMIDFLKRKKLEIDRAKEGVTNA